MRVIVCALCALSSVLPGCGEDMTGGTGDAVPTSCAALKAENPSAPSGTYTVDPDGSGPLAPFTVTCNMTEGGGGWTVLPLKFGDKALWSVTQAGEACIDGPTLGEGKSLSFHNKVVQGAWNFLSFKFLPPIPVKEVLLNGLVHSTHSTSNNMDLTYTVPPQTTEAITESWYFADSDPMTPVGYVFEGGCVTQGYLDPGLTPPQCSMSKPGDENTVALTRRIALKQPASRFHMVVVQGCASDIFDLPTPAGQSERFLIDHPSSGGVWKEGILVR